YVESIRGIAEKAGIAKIVPRDGWKPGKTSFGPHNEKVTPAKRQEVRNLINSDKLYGDGEKYTIPEYRVMADRAAKEWRDRDPPVQMPRNAPRHEPMEPKKPNTEVRPGTSKSGRQGETEKGGSLRSLEREYWNIVDGGAEEMEVEYANDLNISEFLSGFPLPPKDFVDGSS
ncbi:unnamed protein product, partial [Pylaiella littoralis]